MEKAERAAGILLGLAAGDRIGGPVRMALRLAQSLVDCRGFSQTDLTARYLEWWRTGGFDTGPTAARVFLRVEQGHTWEAAARQIDQEAGGLTAGCNPAHRSAPLAMCAAIQTEALAEWARQEAKLTHYHPLAGDVAATVVCVCRFLIEGDSWEVACQKAILDTESVAVRALSRGGFAPEVLRAAVALMTKARSAEEALESAIVFAGPANYCPVLVGSLAGARWGASAIPTARQAFHSSLLPQLYEAAQSLAGGWSLAKEE